MLVFMLTFLSHGVCCGCVSFQSVLLSPGSSVVHASGTGQLHANPPVAGLRPSREAHPKGSKSDVV